MIFHIGKGKTLRQEDIIGIFDLDNATVSGITRRFLSRATAEKKVSYGDVDIPRSFLLVGERKKPHGMALTAAGEKANTGGEKASAGVEKASAGGEKASTGGKRPRKRKTAADKAKMPAGEGRAPRVFLSHISSLSLLYRAENPLAGMEEE